MLIGIIIGSIRDGRRGESVGRWVEAAAEQRDDAEFRLIDLRSFDVPLLTDATLPAAAKRQYESEGARRWSRAIDECDGFVFVTPEYNHGVPGAFKNAVDTLAPEWQGKAVAFVSYGSDNGTRSVEQWRQIVANFEMYDIRTQVSCSTFEEFDGSDFEPNGRRDEQLEKLLDQLVEQTRMTTASRAARAEG